MPPSVSAVGSRCPYTGPMTNSSLIVFLPLVAAFVGAIIGAWANSWYRNREAKKAEVREREGLLLLIDLEVHYNNEHLDNCIRDEAKLFDLLSIIKLRTDFWDGSAARLTQLLAPLEVGALTVYYKEIARIRDVIEWSGTPRHESIAAALSNYGKGAIEMGDAIRDLIHTNYFKGKPPQQLIPIPPNELVRALRKATNQPEYPADRRRRSGHGRSGD